MIIEKIAADMKSAMLGKEAARLQTLRLVRAEFLKAEKEKGEALTEERAMAILQSMIKQRRDSIEQFTAAGRADLAVGEEAEMALILQYLPAVMTDAEMDAIIDATLSELSPIDPRMMGKAIGAVMGKLKATGKPYDAKAANDKVKTKIQVA